MRKIKGTHQRPRLSIFRSNRMIYAQIIDDKQGKTLVAVCDKNSEKQSGAKRGKEGKGGLGGTKTTKTEKALRTGEALAKMAIKRKIKLVVFDRGNFRYHGRVKALAEGARKGGLDF